MGAGETKIALAYGATNFANAAMQQLFVTYYIDVFMNINGVTSGWFFFGELVFLLWNSIDDVLFGWIIDTCYSSHSYDRHRTSIIYGGFLWSVSFVVLFYPDFDVDSSPIVTGLHFALSLCFYDGCLSWVMVSHSALLADITYNTKQRAKCNMFSALMSSIGCFSVFFGRLYWDSSELDSFRRYCAVLAIISAFGFQFTAHNIAKFPRPRADEELGEKENVVFSQVISLRTFLVHISSQWNLILWMGVSTIQVFNCHFNSNFFSIFIKYFMGNDYVLFQSVCIFLSSICPHFVVMALSPLVATYGVYPVIKGLIICKITLAVLALSLEIAWLSWTFIPLYLLLNKVFNEALCRHGNIVVANLVDEDAVRYNRKTSVSAMMFGVVAFVTKPGQSLAPMFTWALLNDNLTEPQSESGPTIVFLITVVPLVCGLLQLLLWLRFTLKGSVLSSIQQQRIALECE
ncbi:transmembrane protein 180-like [Pelomyxa schiedti]|nr:transmembrane protein 180-like [Pelomyxa schiedti]